LGQAAVADAMKWQLTILVCLLAVAALAVRVIDLDRRPMHADEGVQGLKFIELLEKGNYRYDPDEYHGPTLNYLTLPAAWLRGEHNRQALTETTLRLVPAVFGAGLVLLLLMVRDGLGRSATLSAALITATSPALVFYSRYYIHETLLVFFTMAFLGSCWRYLQTRNRGWAAAAGAAFGLMHATKETFVIELFAMMVALAVVIVTRHKRQNAPEAQGNRAIKIEWSDVGLGLVVAMVVSVIFYTSFFRYWRGPVDSVLTYFPWLRRAGGASPHIHPWWFYLERLAFFKRQSGPVWSEASLLVLAIAGIGGVNSPRSVPGCQRAVGQVHCDLLGCTCRGVFGDFLQNAVVCAGILSWFCFARRGWHCGAADHLQGEVGQGRVCGGVGSTTLSSGVSNMADSVCATGGSAKPVRLCAFFAGPATFG
jgi:4-amino-4-deoxy-L-arabinose transferase-like glycosyltransferase